MLSGAKSNDASERKRLYKQKDVVTRADETARIRKREMVRFNGPSRHYGSASLERSSEVARNRAAMRNESAVLRYYAKSQDPRRAFKTLGRFLLI